MDLVPKSSGGTSRLLGMRPSSFVLTALSRIPDERSLQILDLGCGSGRYAVLLARLGHRVTALDIDPRRLHQTAEAVATLRPGTAIDCVQADAAQPLPFRDESFDLIVAVEFVSPGLMAETVRLLRPGGYLLVQTFGGQGENWRALPLPGQFKAELEGACDLIAYQEQLVGPTKREAVSVRLLARRA